MEKAKHIGKHFFMVMFFSFVLISVTSLYDVADDLIRDPIVEKCIERYGEDQACSVSTMFNSELDMLYWTIDIVMTLLIWAVIPLSIKQLNKYL